MSRTERKLRQALAEIEALRADRPRMEESIRLLTSQNFEMHSALREAEVALSAAQAAESRLGFALMLVRAALGMQPKPQALWCSLPTEPKPKRLHTDECSGWNPDGKCDCGARPA